MSTFSLKTALNGKLVFDIHFPDEDEATSLANDRKSLYFVLTETL